ncbi:MAG: type II toxin-antitoxin system VapC family toxin [Rubrobacteraceae bacterium]
MSRLVLIDSSAWIEYLRLGRGAASDAVDGLLQEDRAALCGIVELEIFQGLRPRERGRVSELFSALPYLETGRIDYVTAGERLGDLRRRGVTIPAADCLIAVLCLRHDLSLLTLDVHFDHLSDVKRFDAHSPA